MSDTDFESSAVAVVTGACGGIGAAISRAFADAGVALALCDARSEELVDLASQISATGVPVYHQVVDVTDESAVRSFQKQVSTSLGRVDHLVNTVGVVDASGDLRELTLSEWNRALAVNLTSAFLVAKYMVEPMINSGGGSIVNLSSVSGFANQAGAMAYSVTKSGLNSLTRSEAIDLAPHNIRANAICPGSVSTPLVDAAAALTGEASGRSASETREAWERQYPSGRFTQPEEVAELALFLSSRRSSNITGATFTIDGGLTALLPER